MAKVQTAPLGADVQRQLDVVRSRNGVSAVTSADEGAPLGQLPDRVFGFTYSPINESTPLYATRTLQSFEVHKVSSGQVRLLGFVKAAEAEKLAAGTEEFDVNLYPETNGESTTLVEVPLDRIIRAKPLARSEGNFMPLRIDSK